MGNEGNRVDSRDQDVGGLILCFDFFHDRIDDFCALVAILAISSDFNSLANDYNETSNRRIPSKARGRYNTLTCTPPDKVASDGLRGLRNC